MKKLFSLVLALSMALALTACGGSADTDSTTTDDTTETTAKPVELYVFAAASMQESLDQVIKAYKAVAPEVAVVATYDSSGTLKTQIQEGADCDVFISAAPKQMNQLDAEGGEENTEGLDLVNSATRLDLLENKVTLAVPEATPRASSPLTSWRSCWPAAMCSWPWATATFQWASTPRRSSPTTV